MTGPATGLEFVTRPQARGYRSWPATAPGSGGAADRLGGCRMAWLALAGPPGSPQPWRPAHASFSERWSQRGPLAHQPGMAPARPPSCRGDRRRAGGAGGHGSRRAWRLIAARTPGRATRGRARRQPADHAVTPPAAKNAIKARPRCGASPRSVRPPIPGCCSATSKRPAGRGPALFAPWEDTITAFMRPGRARRPR